ncbi:MAG: ATP-dependent DNA helicase [Deltaproteobacteria bacterium]|nr:MAG: ATP-dependent DNA helicase [Deltaproteobacteria bacterium]
MSTSLDPIQDILGPDGLIARSLEEFEFRASQIQMACLIEKAVQKKIQAIVEAGTGTGKTLGYLVPLVLSGKKAVISTGTKNLQEQIFFKDIPLLAKATGLKVDSMLMKGRKNYLCLHRYFQYFSGPSLLRPDQAEVRKRIEKWLGKTEFADRSELAWMRDDDLLWDSISSTSDQCLGSECMHMDDCYLNALRKKAAQSKIIIVNHHLFFADLMVKKGGFGEIIPRFQVVIFDEAHSIEEIATSYFGESLSTNQLMELVNDLEKETKNLQKRVEKNLTRHLDLLKTGSEHLRELLTDSDDKGRLNDEALEVINMGPVHDIRKGLNYIYEKSGLKELKNASLQAYATRAGELDQRLERVLSFSDPDRLNWYEKRKKGVVLHASPLDISQHMKEFLYQKGRTTVFTSATLSANGNFDYFRSRVGLSEDVLEGIYPSDFHFEKQTLMYIPKDLPPPTNPDFGPRAAERILDILKITSGRALVLFTSYHNLNLVHQLLNGKIPYTTFKQGEAPRSLLLEEFRRDTHSVLLATGSFWQGVDVPGEALSCLIIDKLPFDSPGDPLVAGRIESIRAHGGNPFMEYQLPSAIISLKQGLGRLIRNASDRGILSILDIRMITSRYGRFFFDSLPQIPLSHELADLGQFFGQSS